MVESVTLYWPAKNPGKAVLHSQEGRFNPAIRGKSEKERRYESHSFRSEQSRAGDRMKNALRQKQPRKVQQVEAITHFAQLHHPGARE